MYTGTGVVYADPRAEGIRSYTGRKRRKLSKEEGSTRVSSCTENSQQVLARKRPSLDRGDHPFLSNTGVFVHM